MLLARWRAALTFEGRRGRAGLLVADAGHRSSRGVDVPASPPPRLVVTMEAGSSDYLPYPHASTPLRL